MILTVYKIYDLFKLIPEFDVSIPACRGDLARFMRVPENLDTDIIVSLPLG